MLVERIGRDLDLDPFAASRDDRERGLTSRWKKAKTEKEAHGEFESEHPGYCGAQDTFYVGNLKMLWGERRGKAPLALYNKPMERPHVVSL